MTSDSIPHLIIGGGAAGFFAGITCAEANPSRPVIILEEGRAPLAKVKISGGGRCNVTHACFVPRDLAAFYPRGQKALLGPFHTFGPKETVAWFEKRGVKLKTESDGRMFPVTNTSQTILDALQGAAKEAGVELRTETAVSSLEKTDNGFAVHLKSGERLDAKTVLLATGSGRMGWSWAKALGHTIEEPVPSLFTFHIQDPLIKGLAGVSAPKATVSVPGTKLKQTGPLLITHHGLSGPAVLKLSAWGARALAEKNYQFEITVDWIGWPPAKVEEGLRDLKAEYGGKTARNTPAFGTPRRLWERVVSAAGLSDDRRWADLTRPEMDRLKNFLIQAPFKVTGKSPFKDEFVTCGGVRLNEVDFRTMESKKCSGLYFAGEILDVDAVTGGFNFQNAWTTGFLAGRAMGKKK